MSKQNVRPPKLSLARLKASTLNQLDLVELSETECDMETFSKNMLVLDEQIKKIISAKTKKNFMDSQPEGRPRLGKKKSVHFFETERAQAQHMSALEKRLEESDNHLEDLLAFGNELVTNIKVAQEKQELQRRINEKNEMDQVKLHLLKESEESLQNFDKIKEKWSDLNEINEPMELFEELEKQKEQIAELLKSKDFIIEECQNQLKRIDRQYVKDQEKQAQEVLCLVERIDSQLELLKEAYGSHLEMLENTVAGEHQSFVKYSTGRWKSVFKKIQSNDERRQIMKRQKNQIYANELERLRIKHDQLNQNTRVRLDKDNERLELELRSTKINALMNSEKLDFNYLILQRRSAENQLLIGIQKKRLAKLSDAVMVLKDKNRLASCEDHTTTEKLKKNIQKFHDSIIELENKSLHIRINNRRRFNRVWILNFNEVKGFLSKIIDIDRIIYEQQLGLKWFSPKLNFHNILSDKVERIHTFKHRQIMMKQSTDTEQREKRFARQILKHIADQNGYLVEKKLRLLLKPYIGASQTIFRLDQILCALQVKNVRDLDMLIEYFKPYSWCETCSKPNQIEYFYTSGQIMNKESSESSSSENATISLDLEHSTTQCPNHVLLFEPSMVIIALNNFVQNQLKNELAKEKAHDVDEIHLTTDEILHFWRKFLTFIPEKKIKLWKNMEHGLSHFLEVLKEREKLERECSLLRRQNAELRHLLTNFES